MPPNMGIQSKNLTFDAAQILVVNQAVAMAEELVSNHYKMSLNQWLRPKYDVKTLAELSPDELSINSKLKITVAMDLRP